MNSQRIMLIFTQGLNMELYFWEARFYYWSTINNGPLSATIITCSSPVRWDMKFSENNTRDKLSDRTYEEITTTDDVSTKYFTTFNGLYVLRIIAEEYDTFVHIYISTEEGGPQALQKITSSQTATTETTEEKKVNNKMGIQVGKNRGNPLNIFIMPCGALIYVEISLKNKTIIPQRIIEKFGNILIKSPVEGARYYIKILTINGEDVSRTSAVEIFVTSKSTSKIPLPIMPSQTIVEEYESLRKCDSVTIGWLPSPGRKCGHYCVVVKEGKLRETDDYGMPNQCGLENRLRKKVITEKINYLKPGKSYIIQVTIKKPKGKTLSYDLLQVHTTPSCHRH
ncbi:hypothetical protein NQ314_006207 [Rhamnusium bicolor]|uniref:Protein NDNF C-terminal domain-containing protein n=1 Tax=Rhamnusium bicolor TaxID=1586634 RepID=A0AAV8Z7K5_9CUCU|nr:hypothetical protein NQ314_006207 [Rhamnusium bicolor]